MVVSAGRLTEEMRKLQVFERRILRNIFGPICNNGKWRIRYNSKLYIMRLPEGNPVKKLTLLIPEGSRRAGRPKLRWLDGVEKDLGTLGIRSWRRRALDRERSLDLEVRVRVPVQVQNFILKFKN